MAALFTRRQHFRCRDTQRDCRVRIGITLPQSMCSQKPGQSLGSDLSLVIIEGTWPFGKKNSVLMFFTLEIVSFCYLSHSDQGSWLQQPQGTKYQETERLGSHTQELSAAFCGLKETFLLMVCWPEVATCPTFHSRAGRYAQKGRTRSQQAPIASPLLLHLEASY